MPVGVDFGNLFDMADKLSSAAEEYIARVLADAAYPSRADVLEAAIAALREKMGHDSRETPSFGTVALSPEECAKLQADAMGKTAANGKSSGYSIPE